MTLSNALFARLQDGTAAILPFTSLQEFDEFRASQDIRPVFIRCRSNLDSAPNTLRVNLAQIVWVGMAGVPYDV